MWIHFEFSNGSNPYIATTTKALFWMLRNYEYTQIDANHFYIIGEKPKTAKTYKNNQEALHDIAIQYEQEFTEYTCSWGDIAFWEGFFYEYGKKYGLLTIFHNNGIC